MAIPPCAATATSICSLASVTVAAPRKRSALRRTRPQCASPRSTLAKCVPSVKRGCSQMWVVPGSSNTVLSGWQQLDMCVPVRSNGLPLGCVCAVVFMPDPHISCGFLFHLQKKIGRRARRGRGIGFSRPFAGPFAWCENTAAVENPDGSNLLFSATDSVAWLGNDECLPRCPQRVQPLSAEKQEQQATLMAAQTPVNPAP